MSYINWKVKQSNSNSSNEIILFETLDKTNATALDHECDFSKLEEVPEDSIEAMLYQIIDDIDTAGDMFKPVIEGYEKYTFKKIKEAQKYIVSDGYKLYYVNNK